MTGWGGLVEGVAEMEWLRRVYEVVKEDRVGACLSKSTRGYKVMLYGGERMRSLGVFSERVARLIVKLLRELDGPTPEEVIAGVIWGVLVGRFGKRGARAIVRRMIELAGGERIEPGAAGSGG